MADWLATGRLKKLNSNAIGNTFGEAVFESPSSGLKYVAEGDEGHRVAHVLNHTVDNPTRGGLHGVFDEGDPLATIDEAWLKRAEQYRVTRPDNRIQYDIPMGRDVGYASGIDGEALGRPNANHVTVVVESDGVTLVTAFPIRAVDAKY